MAWGSGPCSKEADLSTAERLTEEEEAVDQRRYATTHEWILLDGDRATVGISEFAVEQLGDVVYVDLPAAGTRLKAGNAIGDIESVKAVSQIYAPDSGEIIEINQALVGQPGDDQQFAAGRWMGGQDEAIESSGA